MSSYKLNDNLAFKTYGNMLCSSCNQQFIIKDLTLKNSRCPILLQCGHSLCDSCLQHNLKLSNEFTCQQCRFVSTLKQNDQTSEYLSLNLYITGCLFANYKYEKDKKLFLLNATDVDFNYVAKKQLKKDSSTAVCEECFTVAVWFCENCQSNFCDICWTKVHTSARSLMKHVKFLVSNEDNMKSTLKKCPVHETQNLEFYCTDCEVVICPHCVILNHQGECHYPITLKDKNLEFTGKVKEAAEEAEMISKRMKQTLQKIRLTLLSDVPDSKSYTNLETEITKNFSRLHGILQLEEERLIRKLREAANERENCLKNLSVRLESHIENILSLIREYEVVSKEPQTGDLTDVHKKLQEVKNLPCYLISQKNVPEEPKLVFDDDLMNLLPAYCKLDLPSNEIFELRSGEDLPEDYIVEPIPSDQEDLVPDVNDTGKTLHQTTPKKILQRQSFTSPETECPSDCSSRPSKSESDLATKLPPPELTQNLFTERKIYSVRVTHIKNPGEFYVTLNSQRTKHRSIDKKASQFASSSSAIPEIVWKDEIYLVKYKADEKWYRGRIVGVAPSKTEAEDWVEVYYLDYGNRENVPLSRLRLIPDELLEEPPMAIKCKLFDCISKKEKWCVESTKVMETMLENSAVTMFVMKVHPDCLEVDLSKICPKNQLGSEIISVRDSLVFLELTNLVGGRKKPRQLNSFRYPNQCFPPPGESFEAIVTHIISPSDFYVQKTRDAPLAFRLSVDMNNFYESNLQKGVIYNPSMGMPCAAIFSSDKNWYRAKILDIPGKKMITVLFVDYGNKETVPWTSVRKLKENFANQPPLAFNCTLAEIQSNDSTYWNNEATEYFKHSVLQKQCRVQVQGKTKSKQKLKVFLYKKTIKKEIYVNPLIVNVVPARAKSSKLEMDDIVKEMIRDLIHENTKSGNESDESEKEFFVNPKRNKLSAKKLRELHVSEKLNDNETTGSDEEDNASVQSDTTPCDDIFKAKVEVLSAESPSCIYVTFPALQRVLEVLQSKLDEFYENSTCNNNDNWEVDGKCAVYNSEKNGWYRATILKLLPEKKVKVFLKDIAYVSTEKMASLRVLDPSFSKFATCAVKCHLSDIRPVGEKWPSISCEFLINELENYKKIYMTRKGEIEKKSLPVELWVRKMVPGSALEPTVKKWVTLNRIIVDQGLAIPNKSYPSLPTDEIESLKEENEIDSKVTRKNGSTSEKEDEEVSKDSDAFIPSLSSRWLPPKRLTNTRFVGMPTYVDYDACIYMYEVEEDEEKLKTIRESLAEEYDNSKLTPDDHFWSPGQLCIVKYHVDNFWYRGVVLETNDNLTYEVLFVDYGNVETCQVSEMRKRIKMADIPILTHKFQLRGIVPVSEDGKWPVHAIEFFHTSIVDKLCEVNVLKESLDPEEPSTISLKLIDKDIDVRELLIHQGVAEARFSLIDVSEMEKTEDEVFFDAVFPEEEPVETLDLKNIKKETEDVDKKYVSLDIPEKFDDFGILVTSLGAHQNEFYANINGNTLFRPEKLQKILCSFEALQKDLIDHCPEQPSLKKFKKGQPCCYLRPDTGIWCRAEIEVCEENDQSVFVFAVDYGHRDYLDKILLRECKNEWLDFPKMAVRFRLGGFEICPGVSELDYITALRARLRVGLIYFVKVITRQEESFEVHLFTEPLGSLAYQNMVDDNIIQITEWNLL